jgi:hypothetical protein
MQTRKRSSSIAIALVAVLVLAVTAAVAQASTNKGSMKKGASWIAKSSKSSMREFPGVGFRADAVSALAASRRSGGGGKASQDDALMKSLRENAADYTVTAGATGKLILAAVAAGERPQCFADIDLYGTLTSFYNSTGKKTGQYGDTAFDQGLAMVAIKAAHHKIPTAAVKFLKNHRGSNGWNFALSADKGDDVESTALIIEAMRAAGVSKNDKVLKKAFTWMYNQRNVAGGFNPGAPQGVTQADTTAYAIRAGSALGKNLKKSKAALRALQKKQGWFKFDPATDGDFQGISTTNAVIALSGRHYPVAVRSKVDHSCVS